MCVFVAVGLSACVCVCVYCDLVRLQVCLFVVFFLRSPAISLGFTTFG